LLFLASGSVIHALGGEQDVRKMGGLKKYLPRTHLHGLAGALSLAGFPLLAGFWSKDAIITATLNYPFGGTGFYVAGLSVAFLTAVYAMRWYALVFLGEYKGDAHPHEAPPVMTVPNDILALGAVFAGFLALPKPFWNLIEPYLAPALAHVEVHHMSLGLEWGLITLSAVVALAGLYLGYLAFTRWALPKWYLTFQTWSENAFYVDLAYNAVIVTPLKELAYIWGLLDGALDTFYVYVAGASAWLGERLAKVQTGYVRAYGALMVFGLVVMLVWGVLR
uniref:proton-conducting transporter transmembrane domain-containing protein n=1 Tax=Oceanithermus sp. TaxID=2268145 RepID=UPI0025EDB9A6